MSAPASRPVHPCVVSVTQNGSRGAEFSTWAYLTHTRRDYTNTTQQSLPNLVTAAGSSIHIYSHCLLTAKLKLEYSFPNVAGTICFLATLTPKQPANELDALLIGVGSPARLSVATLERNDHGPLLQAVVLMDFSSILAGGTWTSGSTEDATFALLDEGSKRQYYYQKNDANMSESTMQSTRKQKSSSSRSRTRSGSATVAVVLSGGVAVAVTELTHTKIASNDSTGDVQRHGWMALEPYILPLYSLSRQLPHLRESSQAEASAAAANNDVDGAHMSTGWGNVFYTTFLSGYLEPVLLVLHSAPGGSPWVGRLARENTSGPPPLYLTALSVGVSHRRAALLWSLPMTNDAQTIMALPNGTSCLVLGTNTIVSVQAGRVHQVLAVNGWAHTTCPAVLKHQLETNVTLKLALQLDASQACLLHHRAALVVLRRGQVYLLQKTAVHGGLWSLFPTGQTLGTAMGEVAQLQSWPLSLSKSHALSSLVKGGSVVTKKEENGENDKKVFDDSSIRTGMVFAGSRLGDSLLLGYAVDSVKLPSLEIHDIEEDGENDDEAIESENQKLKRDPPTNGEDEKTLAMEEEALYAPEPEQSEDDKNNSSINIVDPSDDEDDDDYGNESWKVQTSLQNKRRRLTTCSVLRELIPLDRIVSLGPVGASTEGPLGAAPALAEDSAFYSDNSNQKKPDPATFGSSAYIFPCGFGSSGGLALVTTPGRDDRTILAEEDCLNVQCVYSLPSSQLVLLGMTPQADGTAGIKLLRQTQSGRDEKDSTKEQWEELGEWTDPRDETMNVVVSSSILLNAHEMGRDGMFCLVVQDISPQDGSFSWRIVMGKWNSDLLRCDFLDDYVLDVEAPDELLKACSPFVSFIVDGDEQYGIACRWSSGRSSLALISRTGVKCMVNVPSALASDVATSDTETEDAENNIEDEETKRIKDFYSSTEVVAVDLFRAPAELLRIQETNESTTKADSEKLVESNEPISSPMVHPDFDDDDLELYGLTELPASGRSPPMGDPIPSSPLIQNEDPSAMCTYLAICRKSGMLELYHVNEVNGQLRRCWICNGGERGQYCLQPAKTVAPLPLPRSHCVTIEEARFFICGPSSSSDDIQDTNLRSLSLALKTSNDDFFLYTAKLRGGALLLERESIYSQCRKTREQTRHKTKLSKKGIIPKDGLSPDTFEQNKFFPFTDLSGQDGLFAALPQPKWIVCDRGRPSAIVHRTRHSAPAGGKSSPVSGFCSSLPNGGFLTLHERVGRFGSQRLTVFKEISPLFRKAGIIPGGGLCIEKIAMGVTVRQIKFIDNPSVSSGDHPLYAVIVSRELEVDQSDLNDDGMTAEEREQAAREKEEARIQRQVEADLGGFDVEQEWVEEIVRDDVFQVDAKLGGAPPVQKEFYSLWIVDAANEWRVVDSYDLEEYEHGLTLQVMELTDFPEEPGSAQTIVEVEDLTTTTFVALGTGTLNHNGEDVSSKGRVLLFEVKRLDPSTVRRLGSHMVANLRLTYEKDIFHGPVTTLSLLSVEGKNRLVIGAGADVNVEQWGNGKLTQVGFFRATMQILNIMLFKNFFLLSDAYDSLHFLVWRESDKSLTLLAKDYDPIVVYAAGIMSRGAAMTFLCHDDRQNLQFFQYAPGEAAARGGNKLVCRSDFHLGSQTIAFQQHYCRSSLLVHSATPTSTVAALKQQDPYHGRTEDDQRLGVHFGTTDSTIVSVVPLSEPVYWRLAALQSVLANAMEANCALSSRAWRLYRRSARRGGCRTNDRKKGVIDGDLVLRYAGLPLTDQEDLASAIGSTVDLILDNLLELECSSLML